MSYRINTNLDAMQSMYYLGLNQQSMSQSIQRLSSGLRINSAADDAAGLAISEKLDAQVRGLNQAASNAQDGISMVQTADGAMNSIESMMQRMRELAVEASNGTMSTSDLGAVNTELQQLLTQVNATSGQTKFNGIGLLDGSLSTSLDTTSGVQNGLAVDTSAVTSIDVSGAQAGTTYTFADSSGKLTLSGTVNGQTISQTIDLTSANVPANGNYTLDFGQLGISLTVSNSTGTADAGTAIATALDKKTIVTAAGSGAANLQIGANASDTMSVSFNKVDLSGSGTNAALTSLATALSTFNSTQSTTNAQSLITAIDGAIDYVDGQRATMGAVQNRLQDTVSNLQMNSNNLSAAESQIKDVNVSAEMVNYSRLQILQQAGTAILAQANQAPSTVMKLLQ